MKMSVYGFLILFCSLLIGCTGYRYAPYLEEDAFLLPAPTAVPAVAPVVDYYDDPLNYYNNAFDMIYLN